MRSSLLPLCVTLAVVAGCQSNPRVEKRQQPAVRLGQPADQPRASQDVLVPEPTTAAAGGVAGDDAGRAGGEYEQPYSSRSWGTSPTNAGPMSMDIGQQPAARVQPQPQFIEPAPAPTPVVTPLPVPQAPQIHIVKKGETLWSIAQQVYGNGNRYHDIVAANPGINPNRLPIGQTLVLP